MRSKKSARIGSRPVQKNEGILLVDKPAGKTSFSLVGALRRHLGVKTIGHAGTLDPFATGLVVMLVGKNYTRQQSTFLNHDKEYIAEVTLGIETDSYDCTGTEIFRSEKLPTRAEVDEVIARFQGRQEQIPPMFSAKKIGGKRLYKLARQGQEVERAPALVTIAIEEISYDYPLLRFRVACSKGTYIRSLAHDLGEVLGTGAHLSKLTRVRSGPFRLEDALCGERLFADGVADRGWVSSEPLPDLRG